MAPRAANSHLGQGLSRRQADAHRAVRNTSLLKPVSVSRVSDALRRQIDPQHRLHPGHQRGLIHGLGQVLVGARIEAGDDVLRVRLRGDHDDRHERERGVGFERRQTSIPSILGIMMSSRIRSGCSVLGDGERLLAVGGREDLVVVDGETGPEDVEVVAGCRRRSGFAPASSRWAPYDAAEGRYSRILASSCARAEGLGHVGVAAGLARLRVVAAQRVGRNSDDRDRAERGFGLDPPRCLVAVDARAAGCPSGSGPGDAASAMATPSSPVTASIISKPALVRRSRRMRRLSSWSSTTRIRLLMLASAWRSTRTGSAKPERRSPAPGLRFDPDAPAVQLDDALGDREPKAGAALFAGAGAVGLLELLEDLLLVGLRDAGAGVAPPRPRRRVVRSRRLDP